jgi:hypothetical protein
MRHAQAIRTDGYSVYQRVASNPAPRRTTAPMPHRARRDRRKHGECERRTPSRPNPVVPSKNRGPNGASGHLRPAGRRPFVPLARTTKLPASVLRDRENRRGVVIFDCRKPPLSTVLSPSAAPESCVCGTSHPWSTPCVPAYAAPVPGPYPGRALASNVGLVSHGVSIPARFVGSFDEFSVL